MNSNHLGDQTNLVELSIFGQDEEVVGKRPGGGHVVLGESGEVVVVLLVKVANTKGIT